MKILIIDNYDSFTYNLVHLVESVVNTEVDVVFNDKFELSFIELYDRIILSPGPCLPKESGKMMEVLEGFKTTKNILGVCLGHQAIAESLGFHLKNLSDVFHGIESTIEQINPNKLFHNLPQQFNVGRYHSWVVDEATIDESITITAFDKDKNIMAFEHKQLPLAGVQFHPESIMTEFGKKMIGNWVKE